MITIKPEHFYLFAGNFRKVIFDNKKVKTFQGDFLHDDEYAKYDAPSSKTSKANGEESS
jgi:hypothetical protein